MEDYVPPLRKPQWVVATAILALAFGIATHLMINARIDRRIADGVPVPAEVTKVQYLPLGKTYRRRRA